MYSRFAKRFLDLAIALTALVVLAPLFLLTTLLVLMSSHGPALFVQERLGRHGKVFRAYKFRTMTHRARTHHIEIKAGHPEVTLVGSLLRRLKIDELPQLVNVLRGDMSVIGPRPALVSDLKLYDSVARRRLEVRPGLTGLAQTHGGIHLSWPERWRYDVRYVDEISFALDLKIFLRTIILLAVGEEKLLQKP
jgi:undecaprenyl phosphate N,N'-diacetylbacillosamine 1-phosphate transferase